MRRVLVLIAAGAFVVLGIMDLAGGRYSTGSAAILLAAANMLLLLG